MADGLESMMGGIGAEGEVGGLGLFPSSVCVSVGSRGGVRLGLHCHTVHTVYAYQATLSASLSHKCLLEFILGELHRTGTGIAINYGTERFV